jgi:hypothetical protein
MRLGNDHRLVARVDLETYDSFIDSIAGQTTIYMVINGRFSTEEFKSQDFDIST